MLQRKTASDKSESIGMELISTHGGTFLDVSMENREIGDTWQNWIDESAGEKLILTLEGVSVKILNIL